MLVLLSIFCCINFNLAFSKTVEDLEVESRLGRVVQEKTKQLEKDGSFDDGTKDFYDIGVSDEQLLLDGKVEKMGTLPDGRIAVLRTKCSGPEPKTLLEIYPKKNEAAGLNDLTRTEEYLIKWTPIEGLASGYYIDSISESIDGFKIILSESKDINKKVSVRFEQGIDSYRCTNESFRLKAIYELNEKYHEQNDGWTFFKVVNSSYIRWMLDESYGTACSLPFVHFYFNAEEVILDVVADREPTVEFLKD